MAYADYLTDQGDPLGEFIRVQLALEDTAKSPDERKTLQAREKALLSKHASTWLGGLAPFLLRKKTKQYGEFEAKYTFRRGWLHSLEASVYDLAFTRAMAQAPQLRLLQQLVLANNTYEDNPTGDDLPDDCDTPQLYPLVRCPYLSNVRSFRLGELLTPEEEAEADDGGICCHTQGDGVVGMIKLMPKLEELRLLAHNVDADQLFSLKTLDNLRILQLYHNLRYPLGRLAKNPSLGKLTHLLCHPHALEDDPSIRLPAVRELVRAKTLPALTHLQLRLSDMGDKGVKEIIDSGILKRLKVLDLRHGCITDAGAQRLAGCADLKNLELLDLTHNAMTDAGTQALRATSVKVNADNQWSFTGDPYEEQEYLYAGDIE
jgi:hypothetical protein